MAKSFGDLSLVEQTDIQNMDYFEMRNEIEMYFTIFILQMILRILFFLTSTHISSKHREGLVNLIKEMRLL